MRRTVWAAILGVAFGVLLVHGQTPKTAQDYADRAVAPKGKGDLEGAIADYTKAIEIAPNQTKIAKAQIYNNRATARERKGDLDGVIADYTKAIELDPKLRDKPGEVPSPGDRGPQGKPAAQQEAPPKKQKELYEHVAAGDALRKKGDLDGAAKEFREWVRLDPGNANAHERLADTLYDHGDFSAAEIEYREAVRLKPNSHYTYNKLGSALRKKGDPDGAIRAHQEALRLCSAEEAQMKEGEVVVLLGSAPDVDAHNGIGLALSDEGDLDGAISEFRLALNQSGMSALGRGISFANAHHNLGNALIKKSDLEGAIREYGVALRLDPDGLDHYLARGKCYSLTRQFDKAIADYDRVLVFNPGNIPAVAGRADVFFSSGSYAKAISDYTLLVEMAPKLPLAYHRRAMSHKALGNYQAAVGDYLKAIEMDPHSVDAYNELAWLLATAPSDIDRDGAKAIKYGGIAVSLATGIGKTNCMDTLAAAFAEAGRFGEAASLQRKAISLLPKDFDEKEKAAFEARLRLYEQRKPYREPPKP
ncbi:MAG TPA: tetratricopeptide repeat protein [Blastocatellia bacterium]|nr:tetratricopeptide repeat protein [Blastocatellia bacterium]